MNQPFSRRAFLKAIGGSMAGMAATAGSASDMQGDRVTIEKKIGQMLIAGFRGLEAKPAMPFIEDLQAFHLGGVILYDRDVMTGSPVRNIKSPQQVTDLIAGLQAASEIPLLVTIDQEGGLVDRLKPDRGFPPSLSASYLGGKNDLNLTRRHAGAMASSLAQIGVNLNLAPVVDLNVNPNNPIIGQRKRSFSDDPTIVTAHAEAFIEAHHEHKVLCCLKHFPGHGSSAADSHLGFTEVTDSWTPNELIPYTSLIKSRHADSVMISHVFHERLEPEYPATLSRRIITGMLRQEMGYEGVVISDDLQMGAISKHYGFESALRNAINAGTDLITLGNNQLFEEGLIGRAFTLIMGMVEDGRIRVERIEEAYSRVRKLKGLG